MDSPSTSSIQKQKTKQKKRIKIKMKKKMRRCTFIQCELMLNFLHPVGKKSNHTFTNLNTG